MIADKVSCSQRLANQLLEVCFFVFKAYKLRGDYYTEISVVINGHV